MRGALGGSHSRGLGPAYSGEPFQVTDGIRQIIREELSSRLENEFYRLIEFKKFIVPATTSMYNEQIYKEYAKPSFFVHCNVINNTDALLYLPQGIREKANIILDIATIELEKVGFNPIEGKDIFISDGVQYAIIQRQDKAIIKDKYVDVMLVGQTMNTLIQPSAPFTVLP